MKQLKNKLTIKNIIPTIIFFILIQIGLYISGCSYNLQKYVDSIEIDTNGYMETSEPLGLSETHFAIAYLGTGRNPIRFSAEITKNNNSPWSGQAILIVQFYDEDENLLDERKYKADRSMRAGEHSRVSELFSNDKIIINQKVVKKIRIADIQEYDALAEDIETQNRINESKKSNATPEPTKAPTPAPTESHSGLSEKVSKQTESPKKTDGQSSTVAGKLKNEYKGDGFVISYPSSYLTTDIFGGDMTDGDGFQAVNSATESTVGVAHFDNYFSSINEVDMETATDIFKNGDIGFYPETIKAGTLNGYKAYIAENKDKTMACYIVGTNNRVFLAMKEIRNKEDKATINAILGSFKIK